MNEDASTQTTQKLTRPMIQRAAEMMPGGFFIYRADGPQELLYANQTVREMFGCADEAAFQALTGGTFPGMVHPDDRDAVLSSIREQIGGTDRAIDHAEYRIVRQDGAVRWVDDYGRFAHTDALGDVFYCFVTDITERRAAVVESRRRAEVIEGLSIDFNSIYLINLDTGAMRPYRLNNSYFQEINDEIRAMGYKGGDWKSLLPVYADKYVVPEDQDRYTLETTEARIRERLRTEKSYTVNYRVRNDEGELSYMQMSVVRIDGENLNRHAVMGYRDVTAGTLRVRRETEDLLRMEVELEKEKHANDIKSAFLFNVSHDIRTPMNAVTGFTALARRHVDDPEKLREDLDRVEESSQHMLSLLDDLLEMGTIGTGGVRVETEPCLLRDQAEIVLDMYAPKIAAKNLTLETEIDLPDEAVLCDASRLRRVLDNLVGNAVKFTPSGGAVRFAAKRVRASDTGFGRYRFEISDTGVGMSEAFMKRMYAAFEREETSTRSGLTGLTGTGVGLAIAKNLLDMMGGTITAQSRKGVGSTFTVEIPLKSADGASAAPPPEPSEPVRVREPGEKRRILLVEDVEMNRMLAEELLSESGFEVESVPDGCDAVEAVRNRPAGYYDLVLMDIQMPIMNGYEATRAIRAIGRPDTDTLPIVALSANARDEDRRMSLDSGMNAHVAKPFDIARLIATIDEHTLGDRNPL